MNQNSATVSHVNRDNFKLNVVYDVKIDTVNTLKITTKTNFYTADSDEFTTGNTMGSDGLLRNKQERLFTTNSDKAALSASVLFKHKFVKPRRTLSINSSWNTLNTNANNFLKSANESYEGGLFAFRNEVDQNKVGEKNTQNFTVNTAYTEPLGKKMAFTVLSN